MVAERRVAEVPDLRIHEISRGARLMFFGLGFSTQAGLADAGGARRRGSFCFPFEGASIVVGFGTWEVRRSGWLAWA